MRFAISIVFAGLTCFPLAATRETSMPPGSESKVLFEENFTGPLDKQWWWVREFPPAWGLDNGSLVIAILPGSLWLNENNTRNMLLRPAPVTDRPGFVAEVLLECRPARQFEHAGIACVFDDDNWVALNLEYTTRTELILYSENQGRPVMPADPLGYDKGAVRLRLAVGGGKVVASFRDPRRGPWYLIGECPLPLSNRPMQVGLDTGQGTRNGERKARFSEFRILTPIR